MTQRAHAFIAANKQSPVEYGSAIGNGGQGCFYRLANGRTFTLSAEECGLVGYPRWTFHEEEIAA